MRPEPTEIRNTAATCFLCAVRISLVLFLLGGGGKKDEKTYVQSKSNSRIGKQDQNPNPVQIPKRLQPIRKGNNTSINHRAHGGVVMQRNEGVHLHAVQQDLNHDETRSFECKSSALAEETNELKMDFTVSGCKWKGISLSTGDDG